MRFPPAQCSAPTQHRRRRHRLHSGLLFAAAVTGAPAAAAHDSWLAWSIAARDDTQRLSLEFSTGDGFPAPGAGTSVARVARAELLRGERWQPLRVGLAGAKALPLHGHWGDAEAAIGVVSLRPRDVELAAPAIRDYLAELGNDPAIAARQTQLPRWRERFHKHAKVVLRRAAGPALLAATRPTGLAFELVPDHDPSLLAEDATLRVCAYARDRPIGPIHLGLVDASGRASWHWSDPQGCTVVRPGAPGYLLRSIHLRASSLPGIEWESDFATLTVYRGATREP